MKVHSHFLYVCDKVIYSVRPSYEDDFEECEEEKGGRAARVEDVEEEDPTLGAHGKAAKEEAGAEDPQNLKLS
jgi:hypothetical protein